MAWAVVIVQVSAVVLLLVSAGVLCLSVVDPPGSKSRDCAMLTIMLSATLLACEYQATNRRSAACASAIGWIALLTAIPLWFFSAAGLYHGDSHQVLVAAPAAGATFSGLTHLRWAARLRTSRSDSNQVR